MKKQQIALLLSLAWLIGLIAVFSFPPIVKNGLDTHGNQSTLSEIVTPEMTLRVSGENPEVPGFKADWSFIGLISSEININWTPSHSQYLSPAFFTKSRPLFDVLVTFFYFFHTW